ncbi:MAG: hypothetical protein HYV26_17365 [Candidatus Hydrogenedentes bacterium]|nr:hypothetical protein [Candidatus Hydrogenedentota bacterium]
MAVVLAAAGARTFIVGSYYAGNKDHPPALESYQELKEAGFNLVSASGEQAALAQQAGLMFWTNIGTLDLGKREESAQQIRERVLTLKDHPALAFYEQFDEPAWTWIGEPNAKPGAPRATAEQFQDTYELVRGVDTNHLIYTNHAPTNLVGTLQAYNAGTDIVATDIYPVTPGGIKYMFALFPDGHQGDFNDTYISQVGRYAAKMRAVAGPNRPVFMVLQAFAWEALLPLEEQRSEKILYPSYGDSRFMAFQSIIQGANGIVYWGSHFMPQPSEAWTTLKQVVREIADLAPALESTQSLQASVQVEYHEVGYDVDSGIQWLGKEHEGKLYLLTCNADKHRNQATLSGLGAWRTCTVLNEGGRTLTVENGAITDTWERFGVHVYEIRN